MKSYKNNEETERKNSVSPSKEEQPKARKQEAKPMRERQFEIACAIGLNFALGGKYYTTAESDFITPGGTIYKAIVSDQKALEEVYNFAPFAKQWVKAPEDYSAKWSKFI